MEYDGFISTLVERSERVIFSNGTEDLRVTQILLALSAGFVLVRDRIETWDNSDDYRLRSNDLKADFKKAGKGKLGSPILINNAEYFARFRAAQDWDYMMVSNTDVREPPSSKNISDFLFAGKICHRDKLKLDRVARALRNSLAHGGVLPMSPYQAYLLKVDQECGFSQIIDRVYFISKWTKERSHQCGHKTYDDVGWIMMRFGQGALEAFWEDWKDLILSSDSSELRSLDWRL